MKASKNKLILGIIVDVSGSMQASWYNKFTSQKSRIEVIKSSLNREFNQLQNNHNSDDFELQLFCLGMGFKESAGTICDLLALSEMVPSEEKLSKIRAKIQQFWNQKADEFIAEIQTNDDIVEKLESIIINDLSKSKLSEDSFYWSVMKFLFKRINPSKFEDRAKYLSHKLIDDVIGAARSIFKNNKTKYENLINDRLRTFAHEQIQLILRSNALGFKLETILENFDKNKMLILADSIYSAIKKDLSKEIRAVWLNNRFNIFFQKVKIFSDIQMREIKDLTEEAIKHIGWKSLKPFVETEVIRIFSEQFQKASQENLQNWLNISSKREVTRELQDIEKVLPESDRSVYSRDYMFGGTPMLDTINLASIRLLDRKFENHKKGLIVISDGGWEMPSKINQVALLLRSQDVKIATGYVGEKTSFLKENTGFRNIIDLSTDLNNVAKADLSKQIPFLGNKLSVHLNNPENLSELVRLLSKSD